MNKPIIDLIIPAWNEEHAIGQVLQEVPRQWVREIIVADNGSADQTAAVARSHGATVVLETRQGYGSACLRAIQHIAARPITAHPDIVVFMDADYADYPEELPLVVKPIIEDDYDLVIGSRALGELEPGAMMPQQIFGNWLATTLIRLIYGYHFTDLGPFRAIKWDKLLSLGMEDPDYGWTVEMQVRAAKAGLRCTEVPVRYRKRIGVSKVSGTLKGTLLAGHKILWTIFKLL